MLSPAGAAFPLSPGKVCLSVPNRAHHSRSVDTGKCAGSGLKQELLLGYGQLSGGSFCLLEKSQAVKLLWGWGSLYVLKN